jgi:hypothetical protein
MNGDVSAAKRQEYLGRAAGAARARDMMGFLNACQKAQASPYGLLAELQATAGLAPEERSSLATIEREMDCYRGKHGGLPHEQPAERVRRSWFRPR